MAKCKVSADWHDWVDAGEDVLITRRGKKVARMISVKTENPFDQVVDWATVIEERKKALGDLPRSTENTVQKMRDMERY